MITVVLTNYRRPANLAHIIDALLKQTMKPRLFVWNNGGPQTFIDGRIDWVIASSQNAKCSGRWWMAQQCQTDWVVVMDDDLAPADTRLLATTIELLEAKESAVGPMGVTLIPGTEYHRCKHVANSLLDRKVDIVKGRYFATATKRLADLPTIPLDAEDDILVSAHLGGGWVPKRFLQRFRELRTGGEARMRRAHHWHAREAARQQAFPAK